MKKPFTQVLLVLSLCASLQQCGAQGTAFTYQGQLNSGGTAVNGSYDLVFTLYTTNVTGAAIAPPVTNRAVAVNNGYFTTLVDFGPGVFTGASNWLAIAVSTNGANSFTVLAPRQQVTPTPYALYAANAGIASSANSVPAADVSGTLGLAQLPAAVLTNSASSVNLAGAFTGNGGGLTNLAAWQLVGNTGTTNGNYLGTTDNQPLEIRVAGTRAGLISPSNGSPNIVFGPAQNVISNTTAGSSILGGATNLIEAGSSFSVLGGGSGNSIWTGDDHSFLGGGLNNTIQSSSDLSYLGGGALNVISSNASLSVLAGGYANSIQYAARQAFLGGGMQNSIQNGGIQAVLDGGYDNTIQCAYSFLGAGNNNTIAGAADASVLAGGSGNSIGINAGASVIGGGQANTIGYYAGLSFLGGGSGNKILGSDSVLVGGSGNNISVFHGFIGGGDQNSMVNGQFCTLVGGYQNSIQNAYYAFLGGGVNNTNGGNYSFLGGGQLNMVGGNAYWAALGGGFQNSATANYATVPGGSNNVASGQNSFAAGANAQATNSGAFVWSDGEGAPFTSTNDNSFNVRANGGARFVTGGAGITVDGQPVLAGSVSLPQLLSEVVTNNEPSVSLGSLFLYGLTVSDPTTINASVHIPFYPYLQNESLLSSDAGKNNLYLGLEAGYYSSQGASVFYNTAIGNSALFANTNGNNNTAIGYDALVNMTSGSYNVGLGYNAGNNLLSGTNDIYIGNAGLASESGTIRLGNGQTAAYIAGVINGNGSGLTGLNASQLTTGTLPLAQLPAPVVTNNEPFTTLGALLASSVVAGSLASSGSLTLASPANISSQGTTIVYTDNNFNSYFGLEAGLANYGAAGSYNTGLGGQALITTSTGTSNTAVGYNAMAGNQLGSGSTAIGVNALKNATITGNNIAIGYNAGINLTVGSQNIYLGSPGSLIDNGTIRIGTPGVQAQTFIAGVIQDPSVTTLNITGGSDLAEPFSISTLDQPVAEGAVVVIDEANPGQLKLTNRPYDTRVAGVVSGANGIHPGIQMHQQGLLEGGKNVALTGRVYVQADTSNGAIQPGDLLTTSAVPGRAMKVTDHGKAAGAILGKAMSTLKAGQGMVLVLVTLQ